MKSINEELGKAKVDGLLVTSPINIFYLSGFGGVSPTEREALLVVKKNKSILITARLYEKEARKLKDKNLEVKIAAERDEYESFIKSAFSNLDKLGFEAHNLTVAEYKKFRILAKKSKLFPTNHLIEIMRTIKSLEEIKKIEKAQDITQQSFKQIIKTIKVGQTEEEVSEKLLHVMKSLGAEGVAFDSIIASGPNSALPHYKTGKRKIKKGDSLLFDFGAKYKNYCADFSRTIFIGRASQNQVKTFDIVLKAQYEAINKIKAGVKAKKVFKNANNIFKKENLSNHFIHSLGHGIGLEVHEKPSLSAKSKDLLTEGMVFSVEPGLYFNWGGVRLEDLVVIKNQTPQVLGSRAKLIQINS